MPNRYTPRRRWFTRLARTLKFSLLFFLLTFGLTAALNTTIPTLEWQQGLAEPEALANVQTLANYQGQLYAGTWGSGVFVYQGKQWQEINQGLTAMNIWTLIKHKGQLYAGTWNGGVFIYQQGGWWAVNNGLTTMSVWSLVSHTGKLYAGTDGGGVFVYQQGTWQAISQGLTNTNIQTLVSHNGQLYAGTSNGVFVYKGSEWQSINQGLTDSYVRTLVSHAGLLYAGTYSSGVFMYKQGQWQTINLGLLETFVPTLVSQSGVLYAGTPGGVFAYEQGQWHDMNNGLINNNDILSLTGDDKHLYIGINGGGVGIYEQGQWKTMDQSLTDTYILTLVNHEEHLYVGTLGDGVFLYDEGHWKPLNQGLTDTKILTLVSDNDKLYVETITGKAFIYQQEQWQPIKAMPKINVIHKTGFVPTTNSTLLSRGYGFIKLTMETTPLWLNDEELLRLQNGFGNRATFIDMGNEIEIWAASGTDIRHAKLPKQTAFAPWIIWRLWVWQETTWLTANPLYLYAPFLLGLVLALVLEYANYVRPFRLPLWAIRLTRLPENFADPAALNRVWPEWAAIIRAELFRYGDVHPDDLRALPALFRRYALKRYLAEYGQHEKVEAQGASLRLLATPTVQAWQRAWAQVSRTMTSMPHLAEAAHAPIEQLTALLAETLGLTNLSAPHHFQAVRAYQVEAPALRLRLPQRFPLIYLADPHPREASIQMLVDAVEVLKESGYFALVIALEPQAAAVNVAQELTQAMQRSAHVQDFIILSGVDVLDLLIARAPITQLTRQILRQVDLAVVSPFVINGPVPESMFFGREAEVKQIVDAAGRADFAILGNRKIGKTSLLRRAFKRLNDSGRVQAIWLDCQAVRDSATFLATFVQESKITLPELTPLAFQQAISAHGRKLVLFIDEAEALLAQEQAQGETLVATWRALAQAELCHFIFAGSTGLAQRLDDPQSAFFNFTQRLTLSYLDETTLGSVLSQPLDTLGLLMDDRDGLLAQVYRLTSGHPNLGQYLGYELIKAANLRQERLILRADLATIEQSGEFMDYFIQTIWGEAPPLARLITLLAPADSFTFSELEAQFHAHNLPFDDEAVTAALRLLRIYAVLQQQGQRYEFIPRAFRPILHTSRDVTRQIKQVAKNLPRI